VGIVLSLGTTDRYCAQFGGDDVKNDSTLTKRKNAPAPAYAPSSDPNTCLEVHSSDRLITW
jgi:hypothetical protein